MIDITEKTFKDNNDDRNSIQPANCMKEFLLADKPFDNNRNQSNENPKQRQQSENNLSKLNCRTLKTRRS